MQGYGGALGTYLPPYPFVALEATQVSPGLICGGQSPLPARGPGRPGCARLGDGGGHHLQSPSPPSGRFGVWEAGSPGTDGTTCLCVPQGSSCTWA